MFFVWKVPFVFVLVVFHFVRAEFEKNNYKSRIDADFKRNYIETVYPKYLSLWESCNILLYIHVWLSMSHSPMFSSDGWIWALSIESLVQSNK